MQSTEFDDSERIRMRLVLLAMILALVFLGTVLWGMQVREGLRHMELAEAQSVRIVRQPGTRGTIFDRNGVCLADTRPNYCLVVYVEELRQAGRMGRTVDRVEEVVARVERRLGVPRQVNRADVEKHMKKRCPLPFIAWRGLDDRALARWAESGDDIPGVDIAVESVRCYPQGRLACHVLGYVGRQEIAAEDEDYDFYIPDLQGVSGMEKVRDDQLRGIPGANLITIYASGFRKESEVKVEPQAGKDVYLTIDARIQSALEEAMTRSSNGPAEGAGLVLDPRNGDVLALASFPNFDPNAISGGISASQWRKRFPAESDALFNKAVSGTYPPGSTFKPVVAIAALESGRVSASTSLPCDGVFQIGRGASVRCWNKDGHGWLQMQKGIEQSCNCFFCQLGLRCEYENLYRTARSLGIARKTGILLPAESAGFLGDSAWKQRIFKDKWRDGDTCNVSIGQGPITVTPLQVAVYISAIANGGRLVKPAILMGERKREAGAKDVPERLQWAPETLRVVRAGMRDVVQSESGTGKRARVVGVEMAGKTGTAEYGAREDDKNYCWMALFAPYDRPRYTVVIVVEEAKSGGRVAAPVAKALMEKVFRMDGTIARAES